MLPVDLVLVRHGQSEGNVANRRAERGDKRIFTPEFRLRHSSSFRLTDLGRSQAEKGGDLAQKRIPRIWPVSGVGIYPCS